MNRLQRALLVSDGFYLLSGGLLGPIYALFVKDIGGDLLDASITSALFLFAAGFVTILLALWEDRNRHKRKFVIAGYGINLLATIGYLFVTSTLSLFVVQVFLGIAVAIKDPAYDALFSASKSHLALLWGEWEAMDYMALAVGALVGGIIANTFGFFALLWCMVFMSAMSFAASLYLLKLREKGL